MNVAIVNGCVVNIGGIVSFAAPSSTPTPTITPSITPSLNASPTATPTPTITPTLTVTPSITPTITITPTVTPTLTVTPSITRTSGSLPSTPANVQVLTEGTDYPTHAGMHNPGSGAYYGENFSPNLVTIGWSSVSGATSYNIYDNGVYVTNVSDSAATTAYSSYVSNQTTNASGTSYASVTNVNRAYQYTGATNINVETVQGTPFYATGTTTNGSTAFTVNTLNAGTMVVGNGIGGPGIAVGTTLASGSGSSWTLSLPATSSNSNASYGLMPFAVNQHLFTVQAVNGSGTSAASATAYLPWWVNGQNILSGGVYNGNITYGVTAPTMTPLGYNNCVEWTINGPNSYINSYAGTSAPSQQLNVAGYNYMVMNIYTTTSGFTLTFATERVGDLFLNDNYTSFPNGTWGGPQPCTTGVWNTYRVPLSTLNVDTSTGDDGAAGGGNVVLTTYYKTNWKNNTTSNATIYLEMYLTV